MTQYKYIQVQKVILSITLHTPALPNGRDTSLENLSAAVVSEAATTHVDEVASGLIRAPREVTLYELVDWAEIPTGAAPSSSLKAFFLKLGRVKKNLYYD